MGFTHYWTFKPAPRGDANRIEIRYHNALRECAKIARKWNAEAVKDGPRDFERLSGFTAHTRYGLAPGCYRGIEINGKGAEAHETFTMPEHFRDAVENGFQFCKTARKPYDTVVTAMLAVLKHWLGDLIDVSSDGDASDWEQGVNFAKRVTRRRIANPIDANPESKVA